MHYVARFIHVSSVSFLVGGAILVLALLVLRHFERERGTPPYLLRILEVYEYGFWLALGLVVTTGIGNIAALGQAMPPPGSIWGQTFAVKLGLVVVFLAFSAVRTLSLSMTLMAPRGGVRLTGYLEGMYGATGVLAVGLLATAIKLAHF